MDDITHVTVRVPATTANLGPGFDCLGLALTLYNTVELTTLDRGLRVTIDGDGTDHIPVDAENLVYRAASTVFHHTGKPVPGMHLHLTNAIPLMSGLGSSSAAIVGGLVAANALLSTPLSRDQLLRLAVEIEGHPDNVAPALLGGLIVVADVEGAPVYRQIAVPPLDVIVLTPDYRLATTDARAALPAQVPLADAVHNLSRTALLVHALSHADYDLLAVAMDDRLHQPHRARLVPGMTDVFEASLRAGAAGVALSGAGPSVVAFARQNHETIADEMRTAFADHDLLARSMLLEATTEGAHIVDHATRELSDVPTN